MNDRNKLQGHLFCILCVLAWGTSFLVSKDLLVKLTHRGCSNSQSSVGCLWFSVVPTELHAEGRRLACELQLFFSVLEGLFCIPQRICDIVFNALQRS